MSLTSSAFLWGLRLLLFTLVVLLILGWRRLARRNVLAVLGRLLSVALIAVVSTANVAAVVNQQYGWFDTWQDVLDSFSPASIPAKSMDNKVIAAQSVAENLGKDPVTSAPAKDRKFITDLHLTATSYGGYEDFTVAGPKSGYSGTVTVWVPPSYAQQSAASKASYPVIEVFHGFPAAPYAFFSAMHLDATIQSEVRQHDMRDPILVLPHWAPNNLDTECVNAPAGGLQMETWLTQDVPSWVYTHFRAAAGRQSWATWGISAGGWCSLLSTMLHPETYGTAISLSGYARPEFDPSYVPFQPHSVLGDRYDLLGLSHSPKPPAVGVWALTGNSDPVAGVTSKDLIREAKAPLSVTGIVLLGGGHNTTVWTPYISQTLSWLARTSAGFR